MATETPDDRTQSLAAPIAILIGITLIIFYACSRLGEDLILLQVYVGLAAFYFWRSQIYTWRATPLTRGLAYGAIFAVLGVYFVLAMTYPQERDFAALAAGLPLVNVLLAPLVLSYALVDVQRNHGSPESLWNYWFWEGNLLIWVWGGIAWFASLIAGSMAGAGFGGWS